MSEQPPLPADAGLHERRRAAACAALNRLCALLHRQGITSVSAAYGCEAEGPWMEDLIFRTETEPVPVVELTHEPIRVSVIDARSEREQQLGISTAVEAIVWLSLPLGWTEGAGGAGSAKIEVAQRRLVLDHWVATPMELACAAAGHGDGA